VNERPDFPLGSVCGKHERISLTGGIEGGLRTKRVFKNDTDGLPLVTLITGVRNACKTMERCMESVFNQDYPNIEYIVIDGASTDGTLDLIKEKSDYIDYYISEPDRGHVEAFNKGLSLASGRFICAINADDTLVTNAVSIITERFKISGAHVICPMFVNLKDDQTKETFPHLPRFIIPKCVVFNSLPSVSTFIHRLAYEQVGAYDESYKAINDVVWYIKCIDKNTNIDLIDDELVVFALGGTSNTAHELIRREAERFLKDTFPFLSDSQAFNYMSSLRSGTFKYNIYINHFNNCKIFNTATYRTVLYSIIMRIYYTKLRVLNNKRGFGGTENWLKRKIAYSLQQLYDSLITMLEENLCLGECANPSIKDFKELKRIEKIFNEYFFRYNLNLKNRHWLIQKIKLLLYPILTANQCLHNLYKILRTKSAPGAV